MSRTLGFSLSLLSDIVVLPNIRYANNCEACKILAIELQERLTATGKTHEVLEFG